MRIAAGAGTGKTDTLRLAIVELIKRGVRPGEILCLTFTVEATKEMRRRVYSEFADRSDLDPDELTVQTYHAFAASLLREHALLAGLDGNPALLDDARAWQLALEALDRCSFDELEISSVGYFLEKLLALNEEMQRHVVSVADIERWCSQRPDDAVARQRLEALRGIECYQALKRERNAIDFGDQIVLAVRLLREQPALLDRVHARYRYVFLDEYQDTDVAQRELIRLIGGGAALVCAVGDVDQGVFGWRGASIHNTFSFPDDFPGARLETLSINFRSGQRVLDLANAIVDKFQRPRGEVREPLKQCEDAPEATIEAFVAPHQLEEAAEIATRIAAAGPPWSQYAVLTRRRSEFEPIFRELSARDVPVEVDELGGFWTRPEIIDVIAWLRVLADPGDNVALVRPPARPRLSTLPPRPLSSPGARRTRTGGCAAETATPSRMRSPTRSSPTTRSPSFPRRGASGSTSSTARGASSRRSLPGLRSPTSSASSPVSGLIAVRVRVVPRP